MKIGLIADPVHADVGMPLPIACVQHMHVHVSEHAPLVDHLSVPGLQIKVCNPITGYLKSETASIK